MDAQSLQNVRKWGANTMAKQEMLSSFWCANDKCCLQLTYDDLIEALNEVEWTVRMHKDESCMAVWHKIASAHPRCVRKYLEEAMTTSEFWRKHVCYARPFGKGRQGNKPPLAQRDPNDGAFCHRLCRCATPF